MASPFEEQFKEIFQRASTELRRTGEEMKGEAHKLMEELRDPARQARMREQLDELRTWVKKASKDATKAVDAAVRKVESALTQEPKAKKGAAKEPSAPKSEAKAAAKKTVGKAAKATGEAAPKAKAKRAPAAAKKTVGKPAAAAKATPAAKAKAKAPATKSVGRKKPAGPKAG